MSRAKPIPLSADAVRLLTLFDEAAQSHGWERDQGSEVKALAAARYHKRAFRALASYIVSLERQLADNAAVVEAAAHIKKFAQENPS